MKRTYLYRLTAAALFLAGIIVVCSMPDIVFSQFVRLQTLYGALVNDTLIYGQGYVFYVAPYLIGGFLMLAGIVVYAVHTLKEKPEHQSQKGESEDAENKKIH